MRMLLAGVDLGTAFGFLFPLVSELCSLETEPGGWESTFAASSSVLNEIATLLFVNFVISGFRMETRGMNGKGEMGTLAFD